MYNGSLDDTLKRRLDFAQDDLEFATNSQVLYMREAAKHKSHCVDVGCTKCELFDELEANARIAVKDAKQKFEDAKQKLK